MSISTKFQTFCDNLRIAEDKVTKIQTRYKAITKRINADYWGWESETSNSLYVPLSRNDAFASRVLVKYMENFKERGLRNE